MVGGRMNIKTHEILNKEVGNLTVEDANYLADRMLEIKELVPFYGYHYFEFEIDKIVGIAESKEKDLRKGKTKLRLV